jgi:hypothetical protein
VVGGPALGHGGGPSTRGADLDLRRAALAALPSCDRRPPDRGSRPARGQDDRMDLDEQTPRAQVEHRTTRLAVAQAVGA